MNPNTIFKIRATVLAFSGIFTGIMTLSVPGFSPNLSTGANVTKLSAVILFLSLSSVSLRASGIEALIHVYIEAAQNEDLELIAAMTDPEDLKRFREIMVYFDTETHSDRGERLREIFFGPGATLESTRAAPDTSFFAGYLKLSRAISSALGGELMKADYEILGFIQDGDTQRYMLRFAATIPHPATGKPTSFTDLAILSLRKDDAGKLWVRIPYNFFTNAMAIFMP